MAFQDQITNATRRFIRKSPEMVDYVFQKDGTLAYARRNLREDFTGGQDISENFIYDGLIGSPYLKGKEFNIAEKQIEQAARFSIKFWEMNVTITKEDAQVLNTGPAAIYRIVKQRLTAAYMTIGAQMAIGLYLNGINANYTANFNGLPEALNDGTVASWDGNTYSQYGGLTRGGTIGESLSSTPTDYSGNVNYSQMETDYASASQGDQEFEPNLGVTTFLGYSYIKNRFQTQQRFNDTQDPKIGFNGLKFNNAVLTRSRYAPGSEISGATSNRITKIANAMLDEMTGGAVTQYPTLTAETLWWLNARKPFFNFYVTNNAEFGLGFTGWKPGQGNTKLAGQVLCACAVTFAPLYHHQGYGITG